MAEHPHNQAKPTRRKPLLIQFYFWLPATVVILIVFEAFLSSLRFASLLPSYSVELQKRQVDSFLEMNKLLITLATLAIGAITGFVVHRDKSVRFSPPQLRRVIASWTLCAASLYFGYLSYQQLTWELNWGFFDPYNPHLSVASRAQFWTFLGSVIVYADFILGSLQTRLRP